MNRSHSLTRLLGRPQYLGHGRSQFLPGILLRLKLSMPGLGELVVFRAPIILRSTPSGFDPAPALQTMQGRIKRPLLNLKNVARHLLNPLRYGPPMLGPECKRSQDKEVESTLRKVNSLDWHTLPFRFYTEQYTSSCRSTRGRCVRQIEQLFACFGDWLCGLSRVRNRRSTYRLPQALMTDES